MKKFRICAHGILYVECPLCKDDMEDSHIEQLLNDKAYD